MPINKRNSFARDSVFRFSGPPPVREVQPEPPMADYRTSVRLTDAEVNWVDCRCCELRRSGWHSISRSTVIRAVIRAVSENQFDLHGVSSEAELEAALRRKMAVP
jgi:hypothetical protein